MADPKSIPDNGELDDKTLDSVTGGMLNVGSTASTPISKPIKTGGGGPAGPSGPGTTIDTGPSKDPNTVSFPVPR
jgi:hypothetical protein